MPPEPFPALRGDLMRAPAGIAVFKRLTTEFAAGAFMECTHRWERARAFSAPEWEAVTADF